MMIKSMSTTNTQSPFYLKFCLSLLSIGLLVLLLYLGQGILIPLFFSILLATILLPVVKFLERIKIPRLLSIIISLVTSLAVLGAIIYFLSTQIGNFLDDLPTIKTKTHKLAMESQKWVQANFNIGIRKQNEYINDTTEKMKDNGTTIVTQTFGTLTEIFSYLIFLPIYTFLILYYKDMIKRFLVEIFKRSDADTVTEILQESQSISQQYVTGLLIECGIVFTLNSIGFLLFGIKYAFFLGLMAALLNLVPYIGMLVANMFCMLITLVSGDSYTEVLYVFGVLAAVQLIDNNMLMPFIVGSKVKLNALAIIVGVLVGGTLCGVPGMFLAIPGIAVMKVMFERVDGLKPWAIILGDDNSGPSKKRTSGSIISSPVRKQEKV
jgi:predicted PurR-regulated permease PerM